MILYDSWRPHSVVPCDLLDDMVPSLKRGNLRGPKSPSYEEQYVLKDDQPRLAALG